MAVVIPTRDTRDLTLECLGSVMCGHATPKQVILVDDGSRDDTAGAVKALHPSVHVLRNDVPRGFSAAVNRGLREASARLLLLLNSDTELAPGALAALERAFHDDARLGVAGAVLSSPDGSAQWSGGAAPTTLWLFAAGSGIGHLLHRLRPGSTRRKPRRVEWVAGAALALRREVWHDCGPLDEEFSLYCQDLDLCLRAGEAGWHVRLVEDCRVTHHLGATVGQDTGFPTDLERLWPDLVRWAAKNGGGGKARRAAWALRLGGLLRSQALAVTGALPGSERRRIRQQRESITRARRAVRRALDQIPV